MNLLLSRLARVVGRFPHKIAVMDGRAAPRPSSPSSLTYSALWRRARLIAKNLDAACEGRRGITIALQGTPCVDYVAALFAVWRNGNVVTTISPSHPPNEMDYALRDSEARRFVVFDRDHPNASAISSPHLLMHIDELLNPVVGTDEEDDDDPDEEEEEEERKKTPRPISLIVYTSGSTGRPKGVCHTDATLLANVEAMQTAWKWTPEDRILHFLPLHHVHGLFNKLLTPLLTGAEVEFVDFSPERMWDMLLAKRATCFMAVPTIYVKMLDALEARGPDAAAQLREAMKANVRLFVSGSAPLPVSVFERFERRTGHRMLERYGMTEIGMALTNPYDDPEGRLPGYVGAPFPGVEAKVVVELDDDDDDGKRSGKYRLANPLEAGDLRIRGKTVFTSYYGVNFEKTKSEFDEEGWFITGDVAAYDDRKNSFKILGRKSADIIKSGGYKISALDVERHVLEFSEVRETAVMGIPDEEWGEIIGCVVVFKAEVEGTRGTVIKEGETGWERASDSKQKLVEHCKRTMPPYQVPRRIVVMRGEIPKNAMGKVNKKELKGLVF